MINLHAKLNPKIFDKDLPTGQAGVEQVPIRKGL